MRVYYDRDADLAGLLDRKIAIVGYGSQGHAHALNLRDQRREDRGRRPARRFGVGRQKAQDEGLTVTTAVADAAAWADMIVMAAPDELQRGIFENDIAPHLRDGAALLFAHGLTVHFASIEPQDPRSTS